MSKTSIKSKVTQLQEWLLVRKITRKKKPIIKLTNYK